MEGRLSILFPWWRVKVSWVSQIPLLLYLSYTLSDKKVWISLLKIKQINTQAHSIYFLDSSPFHPSIPEEQATDFCFYFFIPRHTGIKPILNRLTPNRYNLHYTCLSHRSPNASAGDSRSPSTLLLHLMLLVTASFWRCPALPPMSLSASFQSLPWWFHSPV